MAQSDFSVKRDFENSGGNFTTLMKA